MLTPSYGLLTRRSRCSCCHIWSPTARHHCCHQCITVDTVTKQRGGSPSADNAVTHQVMYAPSHTDYLTEGVGRSTSTIRDCNDQCFIAEGTTADITLMRLKTTDLSPYWQQLLHTRVFTVWRRPTSHSTARWHPTLTADCYDLPTCTSSSSQVTVTAASLSVDQLCGTACHTIWGLQTSR